MKYAFGGKMRAGKDTSVDYLISKYGGHKISFADPIYDILNYAQLKCSFDKVKDRKFLQYIGTDWARQIDPDVWTNLAITTAKKYEQPYISDIRFQNELDAVKAAGFICIKIERDTVSSDTHESEDLNVTGWDIIIRNNDSIEKLYKLLDAIYLRYE